MNNKSTIDLIQDCITWLDDHNKSTDLVRISQTIDRLAVLTVSLGHEVSSAYGLMNDLEDTYDIKFAEEFVEAVKDMSAAAAKPYVEAKLGEDRRNFTKAKNGYKRLSVFLERVDKTIESYRQFISVSKLDLKNN